VARDIENKPIICSRSLVREFEAVDRVHCFRGTTVRPVVLSTLGARSPHDGCHKFREMRAPAAKTGSRWRGRCLEGPPGGNDGTTSADDGRYAFSLGGFRAHAVRSSG